MKGGDLDVVVSGTPLLLGGDILTAIDGKALSTLSAVGEALGGLAVGREVKLEVRRGGETLRIDLVVAERPLLPQDVAASRTATPVVGPLGPGSRPPFSFGRSSI